MTTIHKLVEADRKDECYLFFGEVPGQPGIWAASVLYWRRLSDRTEPALEHFLSAKSGEDAKSQAEAWVREHLFEDYSESLLRET